MLGPACQERFVRLVSVPAGEAARSVAVVRGDASGVAGRRPCLSVAGERGKRPDGARRAFGLGAGAPSAVAAGRGGGPVLVAGVTTHDGGRKSRPRAKGSSEDAAWSDGGRSPVNTRSPRPSPAAREPNRRRTHAGTTNPTETRQVTMLTILLIIVLILLLTGSGFGYSRRRGRRAT